MSRSLRQTSYLLSIVSLVAVAACSDNNSPVPDPSPTAPGGGTGTGTAGGRGPAPVPLNSAGTYAILAKTGISTVPTSVITGNIGLSPAAASFITGFSLVLPVGASAATSSQVSGSVLAANYAAPTPANLTTAVSAMEAAYLNAAGRVTPDFTNLNSGNLGGLTLPAGLYRFASAVTIPTDVTLSGNANDVWIFQIAGGLTMASGTRVLLTGGALPANVFWQTTGVVSLGTTARIQGQVLSQTSITLGTGATALGRLLAQTAVTLDASTVTLQ